MPTETNLEYVGMDVRFGKCLAPTPFEIRIPTAYQWEEMDIDPVSFVGAKAEIDGVWYILESYDATTYSYSLVPITDAPSLSQPKDYTPALGGSRKQKGIQNER